MSDNYRALTRTYRPKAFDDIVSQSHVSDTLKNAIEKNRLAHAYMFCGPRGVGKTTMARVLARTVNSIEQDIDGESLNQTLNVIEIDAASNNGVEDIRDLRERVRIPPQNGRYKIYIIDEVHMLSKAAFNALLKTLEEPPDHVIFIFATTEPHKVLPTILSRVQRFDFKRISVDEIVSRLAKVAKDEGIQVDNESLHVIAKKADGALRDALGLMDQAIAFCGTDIQHEELLRALNVVSTERMFEFMNAVEQHDANQGLELINQLLQDGYDIQEFLIGLTEHLRNLYVAKSSNNMHLVEESPETKQRYKESASSFTEDDLMRMLHIVSEAQYKIKDAHQPRIQFEITLLKLIHMERTENLNTLLSELEDLKKKLSNGELASSAQIAANGKQEANDTPQDEDAPAQDLQSQQEVSEPHTNGTAKETQEPKVSEEQKEQQAHTNGSSNGSPDSKAPHHSEVQSPKTVEEDEASSIFGNPSLNTSKNHSPEQNGQTANQAETDTAVATTEELKEEPKNIDLNLVKNSWDDYVELLKSEVPQMLYFQMMRLEPIKLKNRELTLRCSDDFAKKTVEENKKALGKFLEQEIGVFLRLKCMVQKTEQETEESMSPYERFKKLQENDPTIKTLVEVFGAELDYNLNQ